MCQALGLIPGTTKKVGLGAGFSVVAVYAEQATSFAEVWILFWRWHLASSWVPLLGPCPEELTTCPFFSFTGRSKACRLSFRMAFSEPSVVCNPSNLVG